MNLSTQKPPVRVAALYRFWAITDPAALRGDLARLCAELSLRGTLIVAGEGINGTVAGAPDAVARLVEHLEALAPDRPLSVKYSHAAEPPFHRMKVRLKPEIVTMGVPSIDPVAKAGTHVAPRDWNALIADPDILVVDTRNSYEVALGSFAGAVDPGTARFREFPAWAVANEAALAGRRIAMFCTGGIRCEKATAHLKSLGHAEVYHLDGGILRYLEEVPASESLWRGECFVFDERVAVVHGLAEGEAVLCRACRTPLTATDRASPAYEEGVSCPHCHDSRSDADRARYAERHRQVRLAEARGKARHIGG